MRNHYTSVHNGSLSSYDPLRSQYYGILGTDTSLWLGLGSQSFCAQIFSDLRDTSPKCFLLGIVGFLSVSFITNFFHIFYFFVFLYTFLFLFLLSFVLLILFFFDFAFLLYVYVVFHCVLILL